MSRQPDCKCILRKPLQVQVRRARITVKDLPISYGNEELKRYLEAKGVKVRNIQFSKVINEQTKNLSRFYSGDRMIFADKLEKPLPRVDELIGQKIRIYHDGQAALQREMLCTKCYKTDHTRAQCKTPDP